MVACRLSPHEQWVLERAEYWVACVFRGHPAGYLRTRCSTRSEAIAAGAAMASDRGAMVYAVYRTHQALTDTIQAGECEMAYLILYREYLKDLTVTVHATKAEAQLAVVGTSPVWSGYAVEGEADLDGLTPKLMLDIFNKLAPAGAKAVVRWRHGPPEAKGRLMQRLVDIGKQRAMGLKTPSELTKQAVTSETPLTPAATSSTSSDQAQPQAAATSDEEVDMAKAKRAKKAAGKRKAKANGEILRPGSKQEKLYAALCREGGSTVAQLNAATGWKESRATAKKVCLAHGRKLVKIEEEGKATRYAAQ